MIKKLVTWAYGRELSTQTLKLKSYNAFLSLLLKHPTPPWLTPPGRNLCTPIVGFLLDDNYNSIIVIQTVLYKTLNCTKGIRQ